MYVKKTRESLNAQTTPGYATILMYYELEEYMYNYKQVSGFRLANILKEILACNQ